MIFVRCLALLLVAGFAVTARAAEKEYWIGDVERQYWIGVQNFSVPDVDSNTYGISGHIAIDTLSESGEHFVGSLDIFYDHDKDHLDFDHIPIRWDVHLGTDEELWQSDRMHIGWTADANTRMNTVSSIERSITALPAIMAWYEGGYMRTSLKTGAGWFFLEIDDDAPSLRGYDRDDLRNSTLGYLVAADAMIKIGACCKIYGQAQQWWDSHGWLQTQYEAAFHVDIGSWAKKGSEIVLSAQSYEYNLDVYQRSDTNLAVLGWDNDLLIRLSFETKW
jgi:hypothetical protein